MSLDPLPDRLSKFANAMMSRPETEATASALIGSMQQYRASWLKNRTMKLVRIPLPLPRKKALHPVHMEIENCQFSMEFDCNANEEIVRSDFQLKVTGYLDSGPGEFIELEDHWRVDTDENHVNKMKGKEAKESWEAHPQFHFQRGGHAQVEFARSQNFVPSKMTPLGSGSWRALMQTSSPRIPSLPFDPVLAIDFCIAQHDGRTWQASRRKPEYRVPVEHSQREIWHPFLMGLQEKDGRKQWLGPLATF